MKSALYILLSALCIFSAQAFTGYTPVFGSPSKVGRHQQWVMDGCDALEYRQLHYVIVLIIF